MSFWGNGEGHPRGGCRALPVPEPPRHRCPSTGSSVQQLLRLADCLHWVQQSLLNFANHIQYLCVNLADAEHSLRDSAAHAIACIQYEEHLTARLIDEQRDAAWAAEVAALERAEYCSQCSSSS